MSVDGHEGAGLADLYIRHAMPLVAPDEPPSAWPLGPAGRAAARELAANLRFDRHVGAVLTSTERKAVSTAEPLAERFGVALRADERLVEAERPWVGSDEYRRIAHGYLRGVAFDGWEPAEEVGERVTMAVREARAAIGDDAVVVVGHGLSLCLHLAANLPQGFDPSSLWARLAFPDAWAVDRDDLVLSRCSV